MKSSALFPFVVLIMAAHSVRAADLPQLGDPTAPPVSHFQGACDSDPEGTRFAEKACYTVYDPGRIGHYGSYRPPVCDRSRPLSQSQREMLAKAYKRAPDYVKAKLCRLTQLFVTRQSSWGPWGWGFWEGPDRPPGKGVYVAISNRELDSKKSIADAENDTVERLLRPTDGYRRAAPSLLQMAAPSDPELAILGQLAHELGHALLADANGDGVDRRHPRRRVSGPPQSGCFEDAFLAGSWDPGTFHKHMTRWVDFGDQNYNKQRNPDVAFNLNRLRAAVGKGNLDVAKKAIKNVYASREFVSFPASYRPEEDVVETYKYKVLADAMPNQKYSFSLDGQEIDVSDLLASEILDKKIQCLRDLGFLSGRP